jgi:hypothetical protein
VSDASLVAVRSASGVGDLVNGLPDELAARRAATDIAFATLVATCVETADHSDDVDVISEGLCRHLGVDGAEREDVLAAARLHDIGKIALSSEILRKPASLDDGERASIRRHTIIGERIVAAVPELTPVARLVRHSHEHWDGSGYPDGLAGDEIPLGSRIVFCADAFHAIRSDRPYRRGRPASAALREIRVHAGRQFDPDVVAALGALAAESRLVAGRPGLTRRSSRLVGLLMILACGVGGSALARSGILEEPPAGHPAAGPAKAGPPAPGSRGDALGRSLLLAPAGFDCDRGFCVPRLLSPPPWAEVPSDRRGGTRAAGAATPSARREEPRGSVRANESSAAPSRPEAEPVGSTAPPGPADSGAPAAGKGSAAAKGASEGSGDSIATSAPTAPSPSAGGKSDSSGKGAPAPAPPPAPEPAPAAAPAPPGSETPVPAEPVGGKAPAPAKGG